MSKKNPVIGSVIHEGVLEGIGRLQCLRNLKGFVKRVFL